MAPVKAGGFTKKGKKQVAKYTIDCAAPVNDEVLVLSGFEKFLHDRIKVDGKAGNLGDAVKIGKDATKITVTAQLPFSKRYLKYLTKKYLKKQTLRSYLRVIATSKDAYELKYYSMDVGDEEEGDGEE